MKMKRGLRGMLAVCILAVIGLAAWYLLTAQEVYRKDRVAAVQLDMIAAALRDYSVRHGKLPSPEEGLEALVNDGMFKREALRDPWDRPIEYRCTRSPCEHVEVSSTGEVGNADKSLTRAVSKQ